MVAVLYIEQQNVIEQDLIIDFVFHSPRTVRLDVCLM